MLASSDHRERRDSILKVSWTLAGLYALWALGLKSLLAQFLPPAVLIITEQLLLTGFFVTHALGYYAWRTVVFYAVVSAVVCNVLEHLSALYGFPFGYYHHTERAGPKLFNIPYVVTLVYMALGYVSWMVAQVLFRRMGYRSWSRLVYVAPLVTAFVFTAWDLCIDPVSATIYRAYEYRSPGPWFGTPVSNYFGWMMTTYLSYLPISLYLRNRGAAESQFRHARRATSKHFVAQSIQRLAALKCPSCEAVNVGVRRRCPDSRGFG